MKCHLGWLLCPTDRQTSGTRLACYGNCNRGHSWAKIGVKNPRKNPRQISPEIDRVYIKYYTVVKDFLKEVFGNIGSISYASSNFIHFLKFPQCERSEPLFPLNFFLNFLTFTSMKQRMSRLKQRIHWSRYAQVKHMKQAADPT